MNRWSKANNGPKAGDTGRGVTVIGVMCAAVGVKPDGPSDGVAIQFDLPYGQISPLYVIDNENLEIFAQAFMRAVEQRDPAKRAARKAQGETK